MQDPACVAAGGSSQTSLSNALTAADGTAERDVIRIGATVLTENAIDSAGNDVDIVGAGTGSTQIIGNPGLKVREPTSTVAQIRFTVLTGTSSSPGLTLEAGSASAVAIDAAGGATTPIGALVYRGARLGNATIDLPNVTPAQSTGASLINIGTGSAPVIEDSTITGSFGVTGTSGSLSRLSVSARNGIYVQGYGGTVTVEESVIRIVPVSGSGFGLGTQTNVSCCPMPTSANINARGVTIVGDGSAGTVGVSSNSSAVNGTSATVNLRNSIINGVETSILRSGESSSGVTTTSNVDVDWSNYDPARVSESGPGTLTTGSNNLNADPMFADAAAFNFRLRAESPLVDRGDPAGLAAGESATDRDGASRVFDGNDDCAARRDIGAFELHRAQRAPVGTANVTPVAAGVGTPFIFAASGSDPDCDAVAYSWSFDDGATASGATVQHSFATPGNHSATVTISDPGGRSLAITKTVSVTALPDVVIPVFASASLSRKVFRVGSRATALSARAATRAGTTFRYSVSEAGKLTIRIQRKTTGRVSGGRCVKPRPSLLRKRRCTRYVSAGKSLSRRIKTPGRTEKMAFSGRIGKRALRPGSYRAVLTAKDVAGNVSKPRRLTFKIVRR